MIIQPIRGLSKLNKLSVTLSTQKAYISIQCSKSGLSSIWPVAKMIPTRGFIVALEKFLNKLKFRDVSVVCVR